MDTYDDEEPDFEFEQEPEMQAEQLRAPADQYEWYEAVVTEIIWRTGRTLFLTTPVNVCLQALCNRRANPTEAADYLIKALSLTVAE